MYKDDCIFCRIAAGKAPARFVYQDDEIIAFHDIHARTPVHILIVPRQHLATLNDVDASQQALLGRMILLGRQIAIESGIADGYRLALNVGRQGGQSVFHLHMHLFGGVRLGPPDGLCRGMGATIWQQ